MTFTTCSISYVMTGGDLWTYHAPSPGSETLLAPSISDSPEPLTHWPGRLGGCSPRSFCKFPC